MDTTIFDAFPQAIITGTWELGTCQHGSVIGNVFQKIGDLDVVIDEGFNSNVNTTPETLASDMLIYAKPCQFPTLNMNALVSGYMLHNTYEDTYYEIVDAAIGKNQETGLAEHLELKVVQTEVVNG